MKLFALALVISIALHFLFFKNYIVKIDKTESPKQENNKKSNVQFVKLKQIKPKEIKKEPKLEPKKEIVKKVEIKKPKVLKTPKPTPIEKKPKKIVKKQIKKTIPKKIDTKQNNLNNVLLKDQMLDKKSSLQNKILEDFLSQKEPENNEVLNELEKLYGREFETFTKVQKAFLKKNHNHFQVITQRVLNRLGYPKLARKLRLSGTNIVEFIFYPDGSIKNLRITDSSGYTVFDKYSLNLIEIAYKDYPRPKTATKLKFHVRYLAY